MCAGTCRDIKRAIRSPGPGVTSNNEPPSVGDGILHPLKEQEMLSTAEPSLQLPPSFSFSSCSVSGFDLSLFFQSLK